MRVDDLQLLDPNEALQVGSQYSMDKQGNLAFADSGGMLVVGGEPGSLIDTGLCSLPGSAVDDTGKWVVVDCAADPLGQNADGRPRCSSCTGTGTSSSSSSSSPTTPAELGSDGTACQSWVPATSKGALRIAYL